MESVILLVAFEFDTEVPRRAELEETLGGALESLWQTPCPSSNSLSQLDELTVSWA
eukprot:CAMPEP_0114266762 /NCGR_PEP_ID=MMETSP0058-20121206/24822_1 /TAXON_ID=36894 /ORGANISM="Pyramimonas parkeae, CCMP726" /LENGTH=55 /DNA_ID=CAMNT_0001384343 /DNA_START=176 /DNA_END=343 /DNA_ORIENTATION=-